MSSSESLRGYGKKPFERDRWICQYCGEDFSAFDKWLYLCVDHIIPFHQQSAVHANLNDSRNITTCCRMCSGFANRQIFKIPEGSSFEEQITAVFKQKKAAKLEKRKEFFEFWRENVEPKLGGKKP